MRKFKNSPKIAFRKLAEVESKLAEQNRVAYVVAFAAEAKARGITEGELRTIKYAESRKRELAAKVKTEQKQVARLQQPQKPRRELTRRAEPPTFRETAQKQRWDGKRWVKITELERVGNG